MILYKVQLIRTTREKYNATIEELTTQYYDTGLQGEQRARLASEITRMQQDPSVLYEYRTKESIHNERRNCTNLEVEAFKKRTGLLSTEYQFRVTEESKLLFIPKNIDSIKRNERFYRNNFYGHKGVFPCFGCEEKTKGYLITEQHDNENMKNYTLLASFCFACEHKYYAQPKNREQEGMIRFAKRGLHDAKITVRVRGGGRVSLDELNGTQQPTDNHEEHISLYSPLTFRRLMTSQDIENDLI